MEKETSDKKIAIIGAGHIGSALAEGLLKSGMRASDIVISTHTVAKANGLAEKGVSVISDNVEAVKDAEVVFLAVKPSALKEVSEEIAAHVKGKTIVSLAAVVLLSALQEWFKDSAGEVARAMPNIPIAVAEGVVGLYAGALSAEKKIMLETILKRVGTIVSVSSDKEIDVITLVSGCGPGIASSLLGSLAKAAESLGMEQKMAEEVVARTFSGTLAYLRETGKTSSELASEVATKGGVTEAILSAFAQQGLEKNVLQALQKGTARIDELKQK